jgi:ribosomal-protein-alanine N-acetyltransferase
MSDYLETGRLVLRPLEESYAQPVLDYYVRNATLLEPWEPGRCETFYTLDFHRMQLKCERIAMEEGRMLRLWLFKKEDLLYQQPIGTVAFNNIIRGAFLSCHLGYKLDIAYINQGYITEALQTAIEFIFTEYGLHRIEANIMPVNKRSLRVVEKLGFIKEGTACQYLKINGKWEDHIHMVLLNPQV